MSIEALHYVFERSEARGYDRLVLFAYADSADKGTGYGFNNLDTLAHQARVSRSAVIDATKRLEAAGELIVLRPEKGGRGRHNRYVVVMGRDPYALADELRWPRPPLSPTAAAQLVTEPAQAATEPQEDTAPPPPAGDVDQDTEPVDEAVDSRPKGSPPATIPRRETVAKRSPNGSQLGDPPQPHPQRANAARSSPRDAPPCPELEQLQAALAAAGGPPVEWRMSTKQLALVVAAVRVAGVERLVAHALAQVDQLGPPDRATAWLAGWTDVATRPDPVIVLDDAAPELPPPCGSCDGHLGGARFVEDDDGRQKRCPTCHPSVLLAAAAF